MAQLQPEDHDQALLRAVPAAARCILHVGCDGGDLGARLKAADPDRVVLGIERDPSRAARARRHLDAVFTPDVATDDPPLEPGSMDCILYGDLPAEGTDPAAVLAGHRRLLAPGGCIVCAVPNAQHHALVTALLGGDFPYAPAGPGGGTARHWFTYATFVKLLLDAGYAPDLAGRVPAPWPATRLLAAAQLLRHLGLHPGRTNQYLDARAYVFRGTPLPQPGPGQDEGAEEPLSFVACVSDEEAARATLLRSPCLAPGSPHELVLVRGAASAADGLRAGLGRARHPLVVWVHQDVYLPREWPRRFLSQYRLVRQTYGPPGVVGVYGAGRRGAALFRAGRVVDRDHLLQEAAPLPAAVDTLDELLLAVPRDTPLAADTQLGFHLYGADLCLGARRRGLPVVAVDALCFHNSRTTELPAAFGASAAVLARRWPGELPIATSCGPIVATGGPTRREHGCGMVSRPCHSA